MSQGMGMFRQGKQNPQGRSSAAGGMWLFLKKKSKTKTTILTLIKFPLWPVTFIVITGHRPDYCHLILTQTPRSSYIIHCRGREGEVPTVLLMSDSGRVTQLAWVWTSIHTIFCIIAASLGRWQKNRVTASTLSATLSGPLGIFPILKTGLGEGWLNTPTDSNQVAVDITGKTDSILLDCPFQGSPTEER